LTQQQDVWVPDNSAPVFDALRLNYAAWNSSQGTPQCSSYLVWIKSPLQQGHSVIMDVYVSGESDPAYDHINVGMVRALSGLGGLVRAVPGAALADLLAPGWLGASFQAL
jgi:hypothetical protein